MSWVCLMYHDVLPATDATGGGPERFAVPLHAFERMLDAIAERGYRGCSVAEALDDRDARRVAISFDDGAAGQYEHAAPALRARGMTATFYVTTDWVGRPGYMTWDQVGELAESGMSVQSHSRSHPFLSELDAADLRSELEGSKAELDRRLGQDTTQISLPGGDGPRGRLRPLLAASGYRVVAGSRWGLNADHPGDGWIRRCTVRGDFTKEMAVRVLEGDPVLMLKRYPREAVLNTIRRVLTPSRYHRWRRALLDALP